METQQCQKAKVFIAAPNGHTQGQCSINIVSSNRVSPPIRIVLHIAPLCSLSWGYVMGGAHVSDRSACQMIKQLQKATLPHLLDVGLQEAL